MRKLIASEFLTLDGVMQGPGLADEDPSGGFRDGGWQLQRPDPAIGDFVTEGLAATGGLLLGRVTYEIFAGYWPFAPADNPLADVMNALPKFVVSTTLQEPLSWANSSLIAGDVPAAVARLKEDSGKDLRVIRKRYARADPHQARSRRRIPADGLPSGAGQREAPLPGRNSKDSAAAGREHHIGHRGGHSDLYADRQGRRRPITTRIGTTSTSTAKGLQRKTQLDVGAWRELAFMAL